MPKILHVALPTPLRRIFDYLSPTDLTPLEHWEGCRVLVPFGQQQLVGIIASASDSSRHPPHKLREVIKVIDQKPILSGEILQLCRWVSEYYHHPLGEVFHAALPVQLRKADTVPVPMAPQVWCHTQEGKGLPETALRSKKQRLVHQWLLQHPSLDRRQLDTLGVSISTVKALVDKGLITEKKQSLANDYTHCEVLAQPPLPLNDEQKAAIGAIRFHHYATYLLDGCTGSGKTEVYLQAITRVLQAGKQALVLVPEIGLTPQTLARFEQRFSVPVVQLHSNVSQKQRTLNWLAASTGQARIVIGTRLAVFTPLLDLGIIIIDEEHDLSFKQQDGLRYSARDVAVLRAHRLNIPLILGSATPALETLHNAQHTRYQHLRLMQRAGNANIPQVHCIDMRKEPPGNILAAAATAAAAMALKRGEQVLVFINRRGYAPALLCHNCGWSAICKACESRLTVHNYPRHLHCHHCDHQRPIPTTCPSCHNRDLETRGQGTERCELLLQQMFPNVDVLRVDQDSMQNKHAMTQLNERVALGDPCILVGTQMLAKGHHFPMVTVAILLDIDQGLFSGDYRGPERMGQQIVQVSGRAGRGERPGVVLLQTYQPEHPLLQCLLHSGYHAFANELLREREMASLPPLHYMAMLRAESKRGENAVAFLQLANKIARQLQPPSPKHRYLGPIPALQEKRNDRFRFQFQLCFSSRQDLQALLPKLLEGLEQNALAARTRWSLDIDPQDMS